MLAIAGSDPSGGAGIQADLKSIAAHGGYGMAAITALTAQNTRGVSAVHVPPAAFLTAQLDAISEDISIDAVKIGMLGDAAVIDAVRSWLEKARPAVVVLDPVMVATSGDRLLQESAEAALQALLPYADLITPNLAELALLLKEPAAGNWAAAVQQGKRLAAQTGATVLVKGGHLDGGSGPGGTDGGAGGCPDALVNTVGVLAQDVVVVPGERVPTRNSHGTGCSLSSAIATVQARITGQAGAGDWEAALREVKPWLREALRTSDRLDVGTGNGPVHHFHHVQEQTEDHAGTGRTPAHGEFAAALRDSVTADLAAIHRLDFIRGLADGSLPERDFAYYLGQDALYLNGYSRVLARAAALAPTEPEQLFWLRSAQNCLEVESELHRTWLGTRAAVAPGPVTRSYLDHLLAAAGSGSYGVLVAAVLPCFWLYAEVGEALHQQFLTAGSPDTHLYAVWLQTYADPEFAAATRQAIGYTDAAARAASAGERDAMALAFRQSARYEVDFFDAPRLHA